MDLIWQKFTEWLKELLVSGIMDNVNGLFDNVNSRVAGIAGQVGATPQGWNSGVYGMIRTLSDNVILPIAGVVLAFVMTLELIQLITEKNNMHDVDTWMFFKWIFKTPVPCSSSPTHGTSSWACSRLLRALSTARRASSYRTRP